MIIFGKILNAVKQYRFRLNFLALSRRKEVPLKGEKHYFIDGGYVAIGRHYEIRCKNDRSLNKKDSLKDIPGELVYAHILLVGVIASILEESGEKTLPFENETFRRKFVLIAAFIQGISLCEQSILQGQYLQAASLIRQEYETIILLVEVEKGRRKDGKNANPQNAPWNGYRLNIPLCNLAHLSQHKLLEKIIGYNGTWGSYSSALPQYQKDSAIDFYETHLGLLLNLTQIFYHLCCEIRDDALDERRRDVLETVTGTLMKYKIITMPIMVSDLDRSTKFYEETLKVAEYKLFGRFGDKVVFILENGINNFGNVILMKGDGGISRLGHMVIEVKDVETVNKFYKTALENGGRDSRKPGLYPEYGLNYYGTFILDLDGNKIGVATDSK